jgi:sodium-dependent dicarboxylate transporter 2/3/5
VLFPLLGLAPATEVTRHYGHEIVFLFLGGLLLALAMERTGLHERVALAILRVFGRERRRLVLGFMVATAAISMWISNTATVVMLLPVALAVLGRDEAHLAPDQERPVDAAFPVALLLGVAFAANIGGVGTPLGSPPNMIFQSLYEQKTGLTVGFGEWMLYGVPIVVLLLPLAWLLVVRRIPRDVAPLEIDLGVRGPLTFEQRTVLAVFLVTACLWVTREDLGPVRGWGTRLAVHGVRVEDSTVAVLASLVLFGITSTARRPILDWTFAAPRIPWGVLLLMGSGFAISQAFDKSGLTVWIGMQIEAFGALDLPPTALFFLLLSIIVAITIVVTEFASNTASASILLPVVFGLSSALGPERFPPDLLLIACSIACTLGFAMPAGTPPNALIFGTGRMSMGRFVRAGLVVDLFALIAIVAFVGGRILLR